MHLAITTIQSFMIYEWYRWCSFFTDILKESFMSSTDVWLLYCCVHKYKINSSNDIVLVLENVLEQLI